MSRSRSSFQSAWSGFVRLDIAQFPELDARISQADRNFLPGTGHGHAVGGGMRCGVSPGFLPSVAVEESQLVFFTAGQDVKTIGAGLEAKALDTAIRFRQNFFTGRDAVNLDSIEKYFIA